MSAAVIDHNYERIRGDLISRGLTYDRLLEDVMDHVCCMLEEELDRGDDFETSYRRVLDSIPEKQLPLIQHQTLLNLDKKYQRMKKFTYVFGLISALIIILGSAFKKLHWPGAGILLTVGVIMTVFGFLPFYFRTSYKELAEKKNPIYGIVGYITLALLLLGALFKIMHWPGAGIALYTSAAFLMVGFIPLYVVNIFQKSGKEKIVLPYIVMVLVGISLVMLIGNVRMAKYALDLYRTEAVSDEKQLEQVRERTAALLENAGDTVPADVRSDMSKIHQEARALLAMISTMQDGLKDFVGQPGVETAELTAIDNTRAGREVIADSGMGMEFLSDARNYRALLAELVKDPVTMSQIDDHLHLMSSMGTMEYGGSDVTESPMIRVYYKNGSAALGIALSEYVAIAYLLHQ